MVTGRTVSRTIRDWVVVRRRCRIQDHQRLQTSTLATHSNDNPDVPTPQSVCWRLQLGRQHVNWGYNIPWRWEPGFLGNIQQPWTVVQLKGNSQLLLSPLERRHQPRPGLREFHPGQPNAGQTCSRKIPKVTTSALSHNATKIQGSCPQRSSEALELSQGRLEALLPSHRWIRWEIATSGHAKYWEGIPGFLRATTFAVKQCIPRGRWKNYVPLWDKECEILYRSFIWAPVGTDSDRAVSSLLSRLQQKQERWEEAINSIDVSHSIHKA